MTARKSWVDLDQDGVLEEHEKVSETTRNHNTGVLTQNNWDRNADGSVNARSWTVTSADGLTSTTRHDANFDGNEETKTVDQTVIAGNGSSTRTVAVTNKDGSGREETTFAYSADGKTVTTSRDIDGNGSIEAKTVDQTSTLSGGVVRREVSEFAGNNTLLSRQQVDRSADRRVTTTRDSL